MQSRSNGTKGSVQEEVHHQGPFCPSMGTLQEQMVVPVKQSMTEMFKGKLKRIQQYYIYLHI